MSYSATVYKIFIASPSDVLDEREAVKEVLNVWNIIHSERESAVLLPVGWDTHSFPEMGREPQTIINEQALSDVDLLIGIFHAKLGSPTESFKSGTVEEVERHAAAGKPTMLYFSEKPIPHNADLKQVETLREWSQALIDEKRGLIGFFNNLTDFKEKLSRNLSHNVSRLLDRSAPDFSAIYHAHVMDDEAATALEKVFFGERIPGQKSVIDDLMQRQLVEVDINGQLCITERGKFTLKAIHANKPKWGAIEW